MKVIGFIGLAAGLVFASCSGRLDDWAGSIDGENGVVVVRNPEIPLFGEIVLDLEEDLSIGREDDTNYLFHRVTDIAVDGEGGIYVVDAGHSRIQKFDSAGRYVLTIGGKGQGPGEFSSSPSRIGLSEDGTVHCLEYRKLSAFRRSGEFLRRTRLSTHVWAFGITSGGAVIGAASLRSRDPGLSAAVQLDPEGNIAKKFAEYESPGIEVMVGEGLTITLSKRHAYSPRLVFQALNNGNFVYGFSSDYTLFVRGAGGDVIRRIHKPTSPLRITAREKNLIIDGAREVFTRRHISVPRGKIADGLSFEEPRAFFDVILADDRGRIHVRRVASVLDTTPRSEWEIFGGDGVYLYRTILPFSPEKIRAGNLYDVRTSPETGETKIIRYRVKNWNRLKTAARIP